MNTLFILKRWIEGLIMPLPLSLMLFALGLYFLLRTHQKLIAQGLLIMSFCFLTIISLSPVAHDLASPLEDQCPPLMQADIAQSFNYILVLGSGGIDNVKLPPTGQMLAIETSRIMEALRLFHANPKAIIVVSESAMGDVHSNAQLLENVALNVGVPKKQIVRLDNTLDTDDEARLMSALIHNKKAVLVTSAIHMKRAMALFSKYGTSPTPSPTNYIAQNSAGKVYAFNYIPSVGNLNTSTIAWHEYLGEFQNMIKSYFQM
ncbi:MAG: YdcF family protein [Psychromonas sp.]|nr:YdcF family protein [Psychromonas sp.]